MIIFIYGDDTFRSRQYLNNLKQRYLTEIDPLGNNLSTINGEKTNIGEINNAINTASLLVAKRMVIIENLFKNKSDENIKSITDFFKKNVDDQSDDCITIIHEIITEKERLNKAKKELKKTLASTKYSPKPFNKLTNPQITKWIINTIQEKKSNITYEAANLLCTAIAGDLWLANAEINKLINYKHPNPIELADVKLMVTLPINDNIFGLTDAIGANNKSQAALLLENQFMSGSNEFQILEMIRRQFKILLQIKTQTELGFSSRQIATNTKIHPFIIQKSNSQLRNFSKDKLKEITNQLINLDFQAKTGKAKVKDSIEELILTI